MDTARPSYTRILSAYAARFRRPWVVFLVSTAILGLVAFTTSHLRTACAYGGCCPSWTMPVHYRSWGGSSGGSHRDQETSVRLLQADRSECAQFPDTSNILLVMKTGASEAYARVPTQLLTNMRCLPDFLIFSDMEQTIAGHEILDSLDTVLPEAKSGNKDFGLYARQKKCPLAQEDCNGGIKVAPEAWALDKYKNIHVAEKAYALRPYHDWYIFVDADTYVVWPTLVEWLAQFDPRKKHYMGSVALLVGHPFAHGGSGYVLSQGTMRAFFDGKSGVANKYDMAAKTTCCGDALFSKAVEEETGVDVKNAYHEQWPTVNGEQPHSLAYGEKQWCQPIVTMHHVSSHVVSEMNALERARKFSSPMRIRDIYQHFVQGELPRTREGWDNMSDDVHYLNTTAPGADKWKSGKVKTEGLSQLEQEAHLSFHNCRLACQNLPDCLQCRHHGGVCSMSTTVKHGRPAQNKSAGAEEDTEEDDRWMSGWDLERIEAWVRGHEECGEVVWPTP
ncbi:hypothetical protein ACRE_069110 [Hapsidospora chrysogenum ATCC 11550]|uniref:N-acetylgalactosaminide beta-1,3-galactosyltransferase n=1 Tax=Hapsidospora chrysogenum (strain ATCC 11550 / CBS 779.69 / DSM 880 / IAM 14645 / JCM 23072 / IMI 49137) TaxID=857340 RepID=A0A086SZ42_HAPC1|nr:hypothetical protein ACRE_069110 [Hapsidospora chrysogenum ATCC 11550]